MKANNQVEHDREQKLLKEILFTEQKLQQISVEAFGKTLNKIKEDLL